MTDPLDDVLRLVAEGRLSAEEAAPILDALQASASDEPDQAADAEPAPRPSSAKALRIEVTESGRSVVNLRVPLNLGRLAFDHIPGLSSDYVARIREAIDTGLSGPIVAVDDDGDGVRIVLE